MYDLIDRPVDNLCEDGAFLLWATRTWSHAMSAKVCPPLALSSGFAAFGALPALSHFHTAMALLSRDALEKIRIAPMDCQRIAEDEAILLGLWRDLAVGDIARLRATLALLVDEEVIDPLVKAMTAAAAMLVASGHRLSGLRRETIGGGK